MKLPILIGIPLLLLFAQVVYPAAIVVKRMTDSDRDKIVAEINNVRAQVATNKKISNMHEIAMNCKAPPTGSFMVIPIPSQKLVEQINAASQEQQEKIGKEYAENVGKAILGPKQTRIGCGEVKSDCLSGGCLIGPQSSVSESDFTQGEPGSNCPNGKASSGLCKYSTSTLSFASVLLIVVSFLFI
ncbi:hypothetical protein GCK72_012166 [Caenorhabditis remanei]|uniref:Uncharacterized protein n=1 Tax=Caenorhabditis remanei TaxID=31234 RepID=A0A6A5GMA3_CAERE|nr:hypothetical protein GCK72_012166 [Caenorhabditis remanei]KAF1755716.1 hypothetical protein GCK72_012166 [Caenorhabditis remanei]